MLHNICNAMQWETPACTTRYPSWNVARRGTTIIFTVGGKYTIWGMTHYLRGLQVNWMNLWHFSYSLVRYLAGGVDSLGPSVNVFDGDIHMTYSMVNDFYLVATHYLASEGTGAKNFFAAARSLYTDAEIYNSSSVSSSARYLQEYN